MLSFWPKHLVNFVSPPGKLDNPNYHNWHYTKCEVLKIVRCKNAGAENSSRKTMIAESTRQFSRPTMWTKYQTDGQKTAMYRVSEGKIIFLNLFLTVRFDCWSNRGRTVSISWKLSVSQDFKEPSNLSVRAKLKRNILLSDKLYYTW